MNDTTSTNEQAETEQPTQPAQHLLARVAVRIGGGERVELVREESGALVFTERPRRLRGPATA